MDAKEIIIQALGVIGVLASIAAYQCNEHKKLMILRTVNESFFAAQYFLLGAFTGMAMNIIGCIRNIIFAKRVEANKSTTVWRIVFSIIFSIFIILTWSGFKSLLSGFAKVMSTVAYGSKNTAFVRIMCFFTSICWFIYNFCVKSYAGCVCEALTICSVLIGIIRIDIPKYTKVKKQA